MKTCKTHGAVARYLAVTTLLAMVGPLLVAQPAWAGERKFLVILATSPKQYPNPARSPQGLPTGGLVNKQLIHNQYFDTTNPFIGSFAEYWEEISYGDVTIDGMVADWLVLPWAIQPPLVNENDDDPTSGPGEDAERNSPEFFYDLNGDGQYGYGASEGFNNKLMSVIRDFDGDPFGVDNGPFEPETGSEDVGRNAGKDVWKPGERYLDIDGDGKWDGLDEATNSMDHDGDGRPDRLGPWIDLDGNGQASQPDDCIYLPDSDNDGNPDCCPNGFGNPGCEGPDRLYEIYMEEADPPDPDGYAAALAKVCPATTWPGPVDPISDCNGNMIDDLDDIASGRSQDRLPYAAEEGFCVPADGDDIPDECQYVNFFANCVEALSGDPDDPCSGFPVCIPLELDLPTRCEYDDSGNYSESLDIVEPFENFLRRWDPCYTDPDVSPVNAGSVHWVKVTDPSSDGILECEDPYPIGKAYAYAQSTVLQAEWIEDPDDPGHTCVTDGDCGTGASCIDTLCSIANPLYAMSYIEANYVGDYASLERQSLSREIYGQHDPLGRLDTCVCADGTDCFEATLPGGGTLTGACVAGIHAEYDPSDAWTNTIAENAPGGTTQYTTKMRAAAGSGGRMSSITATPIPGDPYAGLGDAPWYPQAWHDRYLVTSAPAWDTGYDPNQPAPPGGYPGVIPNVPRVQPVRDVNQEDYDPATDRRFFKANFGGLNGDGTGWIGEDLGVIVFETGLTGLSSFEENLNAPIMPEEVDGEEEPGIFYDGYVEHDDLPSSKYHTEGDQRLGEITSPWRSFVPSVSDDEDSPLDPEIWGHDIGSHMLGDIGQSGGDQITPAAGPLATGIHGTMGRDGGNMLMLEYMTWRTDGTHYNNGIVWEGTFGMFGHPYCGPGHPMLPNENMGFRDYNLDGMIDQGEVRFAGSENYLADSYNGTVNNGVYTVYPWNRTRLVEDCVEVLDEILDFDDFVDAGTLAHLYSAVGVSPGYKPLQYMMSDYPEMTVTPNGVLSGIVLLPAGAGGDVMNLSTGFFPIHNNDNEDTEDMFPIDPTKDHRYSWNLFFHNLVFQIDAPGEFPGQFGDVTDYQTSFAAHEYGHSWHGWPDLYDLDVWGPPGQLINRPIGGFDLMATGGMVHPIACLKEFSGTEWIKSVDLTTILTPGVQATLTLPPAELVRDDSYFYIENEARLGERHYFWSAGYQGFDQADYPGFGDSDYINAGFPVDFTRPARGMLILHSDFGSNPDALPPQQGSGTRFTYKIIQADGLGDLEAGVNNGEDGDLWPGTSGNTHFSFDTVPPARWYTQNAWTGISITDIRPDGLGSVAIDITWTPTSIPGLSFTTPPGGVSVADIYQVRAQVTDVYGGTDVRFYYTDDPDDISIEPAGGNYVASHNKITPGTHDASVDWDIAGIPDDVYYLFAELIPGHGSDGDEIAVSIPRAHRNNAGDGTLVVDAVDVSRVLVTGDFGNVSEIAFRDPTTSTDFTGVVNSGYAIEILGGSGVVPGIYFVWRIDAQRLAIMANNPFTAESQNPLTGTGPHMVSGYNILMPITCPIGTDPPCFSGPIASGIAGQFETFYGFLPYPEIDFQSPTPGNVVVQEDDRLFLGGYSGTGLIARDVLAARGDPNILADFRTLELKTSPIVGSGPHFVDEWELGRTGTSRSESWMITCVSTDGYDWKVNSTLTLPVPADDAPDQDPYEHLILTDGGSGTYQGTYSVAGVPVTFTITEGSVPFQIGDSFTFMTTGFTAASRQVQIVDGQIDEAPTAVIVAAPLSGKAPLTVEFDGRDSWDPNGQPLQYLWSFDDGSPSASGAEVSHTFTQSRDFTVTLRVTNPNTGLFGESFVDVQVFNNSPHAEIIATSPTSGPTPLDVDFSAAQSNDLETPGDQLIYEWHFGDGETAGTGEPGEMISVSHHYSTDGEYTATLIVTDEGGKWDDADVGILVGNTRPVPDVWHSAHEGPGPEWLVTFNAINSYDAEDTPADIPLMVTWKWGDGSPDSTYPATGPNGVTNGSVPHTFSLISGTDSVEYGVTAIVTDSQGASTTWAGVTVKVSDGGVGASDPFATFTITPAEPSLDEQFIVDGHLSFDRPAGSAIASYSWDFDDGTTATGVTASHTYTEPGDYDIRLTVADANSPPNTNTTARTVTIAGEGGPTPGPGDDNSAPTAILIANPHTANVGDSIHFDASASSDPDGDELTYLWNFGGGNTAAESVVDYIFEEAGTFNVMLTVTDSWNAFSQATQQITIVSLADNHAPVAYITSGPRTATENSLMAFDGRTSFDPDGDLITYEWTITDENGDPVGDPLTGAEITKRFPDSGRYNIQLIVMDQHGAIGTSEEELITITVRQNLPTNENDNEVEPTQPVTPTSRFCGFGMLPSLFGMLFGLSVMMAGRRRLYQ